MRFGVRLTWGILPFALTAPACQAQDAALTVGFYKLDDQRLSGETTAIGTSEGFSDLSVLVTIDTTGRVISAEATDNYQKLDPAPALALVRQWSFRPQSFEGKLVNAVGKVSVAYRQRPIPADTKAVFPAGALADMSITLQRSACYGSCPDYRVTVHGDGLVEFDTGDDHFTGTAAEVHLKYNGHNVLLPGRHSAHVDPAVATRLIDRFRAAHFFGLRNAYVYSATDNPTQRLTVRVGNVSKTVTDYIGTHAGMPQEVSDLEDAVDEAAGSARWISGNEQTLAELDAARFDYHSQAGADLVVAAASKLGGYRAPKGIDALVLGLIDRKVPLNTVVGGKTVGSALVSAAARQGDDAVFEQLAKRGMLADMPSATLATAFGNVGCSPAIARKLVDAGADPRFTGDSGTPLTNLKGSAATCEEHPERLVEMARTLIALGVPLEARDSIGWTALMGCDSPDLARVLLEHGADPKAHDEEGTTTVLATDDDRVAIILLRAGADPRAHNKEGSVRSNAVKGHWPATLAWLNQHGIT